MILKDTPKPSINLFRYSYWLVGLGLLILAGGVLFYPFSTQPAKPDLVDQVWCDAETLLQQPKGNPYFQAASYTFENGHTQSEEMARTGNFSSKLDAQNRFGMLYRFRGAVPGQMYRATVWRYGSKRASGFLVARMKGGNGFYRQRQQISKIDQRGWGQLELSFMIPLSYDGEEISVYVYTNGLKETYFDDLTLMPLAKNPVLDSLAADSGLNHLDIRVSPTSLSKLQEKRRAALAQNVLIQGEDAWVKGKLFDGTREFPIKLRLKGDWVDHLSGKKWSFRIQVKGGHSWNRMLTFSLHNPKSRNFLSEWLFHRFMEQEDVLTTRYDFTTVSLNGEALGIYAYEEHFEKQLIEHKNRREGPIVRYAEEGMWNALHRGTTQYTGGLGMSYEHTTFESSEIKPFKEAETLTNPALTTQFEIAQTLLNQYRYGLQAASDIFDVEALAKYYAITDLNRTYHGIVWHNQRFYYNPVLGKLEPIAFDGFTDSGRILLDRLFLGMATRKMQGDFKLDQHWHDFEDPKLMTRYIHYLEKYSRQSFLDRFLLTWESPRLALEKQLQKEFPEYKFDDELHEQGLRIRATMFPISEASLRAYTQQTHDKTRTLKIANFHFLPLTVAGFGTSQTKITHRAEEEVYLNGHDKRNLPIYQEIAAPGSTKFIFYHLPGNDSLFYSSISPWIAPEYRSPVQEMLTPTVPTSNALFLVEGKEIRFRMGALQLDTPLVIPGGYQVHIAAGTTLDLKAQASIISYSPMSMLGTADEPIRIHSSDGTGGGLAVLQAQGKSIFHHVTFENLNTPKKAGWELTGAVTLYESDVLIDHCIFTKIHSEDALNLIRSGISVQNSLISHTFSDGLDIDFCTGKVLNCQFSHTGNDGMDISGSRVEIVNCTVIQAGDKGLSVGEESRVQVNKLRIEHSKTGVAAKDLSELNIESIQLEACEVGFAAYQKKPEFGGARITVSGSNAKQIRHLHLIEKGSVLLLNGKEVETI